MVLLGKLLWQKGWEERAVLPRLLSNVTMLELGWCTGPKEEALEKSCGAGEADGISPTAFVSVGEEQRCCYSLISYGKHCCCSAVWVPFQHCFVTLVHGQ